MHLGAGIVARVYRMPRPCLTVSVPAPGCRSVAVEHHRRAMSRIARPLLGKPWHRWTFNCPVCWLGDRRVSGIHYTDGLMGRGSCMVARVYRMPRPGLTVSVPAPGGRSVAV